MGGSGISGVKIWIEHFKFMLKYCIPIHSGDVDTYFESFPYGLRIRSYDPAPIRCDVLGSFLQLLMGRSAGTSSCIRDSSGRMEKEYPLVVRSLRGISEPEM